MRKTQETWVRSLAWKDPLEEVMATHSSVLAWRISWTEEPDSLTCPWGCKELDTTEHLNTHARVHTYTHTHTHLSSVFSSVASPTAFPSFTPQTSSLFLKLTKHTPAPGLLHLLFPMPAAPTTDVFAALSLDSCRSLFQMLPLHSCLS